MPSLIQPWKVLLGELDEDSLPRLERKPKESDSLTGQPPGLALWTLNKIVKKSDVALQSAIVAKMPFHREACAPEPSIAEANTA